ncbi:uncharacterized protein DS421_17g574960 [Arachis hypogaea]|nr:uncharacterized protein DS421_17g574960 [Arachis hypogaea]
MYFIKDTHREERRASERAEEEERARNRKGRSCTLRRPVALPPCHRRAQFAAVLHVVAATVSREERSRALRAIASCRQGSIAANPSRVVSPPSKTVPQRGEEERCWEETELQATDREEALSSSPRWSRPRQHRAPPSALPSKGARCHSSITIELEGKGH